MIANQNEPKIERNILKSFPEKIRERASDTNPNILQITPLPKMASEQTGWLIMAASKALARVR